MHKASQKSLFELLNRLPNHPRPRQPKPAEQVQVFTPTCGDCGHIITPRYYDSDFCPWCGHYGASLPF